MLNDEVNVAIGFDGSSFKYGDRVKIADPGSVYVFGVTGTVVKIGDKQNFGEGLVVVKWDKNPMTPTVDESALRWYDSDPHIGIWADRLVKIEADEAPADTPKLSENDSVNHPNHYNQGKIEVIDFIEDQGLDFHLGNVVKYVSRADHKGKPLEDLKKALWYLERAISLRETVNDD